MATVSRTRTIRTFMTQGSCSETAFNVINRADDFVDVAGERAALHLSGGLLQQGHQCGLLWGSALAAGARTHREYGSGPHAEARTIRVCASIVQEFRSRKSTIECRELTKTDWEDSRQMALYMLKGGPLRCFGLAGGFVRRAHRKIEHAAKAEVGESPPSSPTSCAAEMARRMGADEESAAWVAGFAGGIGLCGGGCGALAAAVWLKGRDRCVETDAPGEVDDPEVRALLPTFLEQTQGKFRCREIVGRSFRDVRDHSEYLKAGGCAELMEVMAEQNAAETV